MKTGKRGLSLLELVVAVMVIGIIAAIVIPAIPNDPPAKLPAAQQVEAAALPDSDVKVTTDVQAGYSLQYLPEDVDVVIVRYSRAEGLERALSEVKKTRTVRSVIAVGDSTPSKEYIFLLERAKYLP